MESRQENRLGELRTTSAKPRNTAVGLTCTKAVRIYYYEDEVGRIIVRRPILEIHGSVVIH
jgi:hypothetical protein